MADQNRISAQAAISDLKEKTYSAELVSREIYDWSWGTLAALGIPIGSTWLVKNVSEMYLVYNYLGLAFLGYGVKLDFPGLPNIPAINGKMVTQAGAYDFRSALAMELEDLLSAVAHDNTLSGDGTEASPLGVTAAAFLFNATRQYQAGWPVFFDGAWYYASAEDLPEIGESPELSPEKWIMAGADTALIDELREQISLLITRNHALWAEVFGAGVFLNGSAISFITLEGVVLERGVWNRPMARLEC